MSEQIDLKSLERRAYLSVFEDGLFDLFFGLLFLTGLVRSGLDLLDTPPGVPYTAYAVLLLGFIVYFLGKRLITLPRLGLVKFNQRRQRRRGIVSLIFAIAVLLTFVILIASTRGMALDQPIIPLLVLVILFVPMALAAYLLGFNRLYLYAGLFTLPEALLQLTNSRSVFIAAQLIATLITLILGGVLLTRFMRKYPAPANHAVSDGS